MEKKDTLSSCSESEEQQMQLIQDKSKESCMVSFHDFIHTSKRLFNNDLKEVRTQDGFGHGIATLFGQDFETFTGTMFLNMDQLQKQLDNNEFQEIGSMASFKVLEIQFQMFINSQIYLNDEYIVMTRNYFLQYTQLDIPEFRETLVQFMEYVKKSIDERALHKIDSVIIESNGTESQKQDTSSRSRNDADIRPIYDEEPMAEVQMTADDNVSATGQQHTEQPESNNEGEVDQNADQCYDTRPLPAKLTDNRTTELSNQLLESENVCLKKTVAQFQKDFGKLEAHCINLELQMENNVLKSGQQSQFLKEKGNEAKVKNDIDVIETINIELEHSVAKLLAENEQLHKEKEHLKQTYKDLFDSIKRTRIQKGDCQFQIKKKRNQFVVRQPTAFKSERPKISKERFASQVDVSNDLSKPVTTHYLPKRRESAPAKPHYMIATSSSRYSSNDIVHNHYLEEAKKKTQEHSRIPRNFSDTKHFVCSTCQKCVFNANHDACVIKFLKEVNSRAKVPSNKTTTRNKPVEQISVAKKPERQIPKGHRFSIKKTSVVHEKTMTPRSCLRWKPTGKIFKTVGLRWVPTGKIFTSSTTKVDSEPTNGSNEDITNQYECEQTLDVSAGTLNLSAGTSFNPKKEGLRVCSELGIHDHSNEPSSSKLVPKVVPSADTTAPSKQELDFQFGPLYNEFFTAGFKGIGHVFPIKSKLKVTCKSDSPKNRWIPMSESEVIKESDKVPIVKEKPVDVTEKSTVVKESDKAPVVTAVVSEKLVVDEKDNLKVTSKVSKGKSLDVFKYKHKTDLPKDNPKDKESDKALIVAVIVSEKTNVDEKDNQKVTSKVSKVLDESDKATVVTPVLKEKPAVVIEKSTVIKESDKSPIVKESDKVPVVKESDKVLVVVSVLKEKLVDVIQKSAAVNEKVKLVVDVMSKVAKDKEKMVVDVTSKVGKSKVNHHLHHFPGKEARNPQKVGVASVTIVNCYIVLGRHDDVIVISSDKAEGSGDWNSLEYQDTAVSKGKEVINGLSFYRMETDEITERVSQRYALLEEERLVIETMAYNDKYKMILDEIWKDKVELDGKTVKEDEEAVKRIKGEALKEKEDPGAFIFPIRLEGKVNENALADTGSDINTMPYRIFETIGREDMKKVDRGITMIDHTQAEAMGKLSNVLCQVGVTTIIAKFIILDIPIDRDAPIVVGRGFLRTMGSLLNTSERIFSTFDGVCHQTFRAARFDVLRTAESDTDDEEEYVIKRNKFGAPIYGPRPAPYLNCANPEDRSSAIQAFDEVCADDELQSKKIIKFRLGGRAHSLTLLEFARRLGLYQAVELEEDGFNEPNFEGDPQNDHLWFVPEDDWFISKLARKCKVLTEDVVRSLSTLIYCRDLDTNTLRDLINFDGKLIPKDPQPGVPRVGIPRPPRAYMQDLYDRMGRMEIRQDAIERMEYRQLYH
ncbi:gag-pol polyprotein [Tanacetum coccineum]